MSGTGDVSELSQAKDSRVVVVCGSRSFADVAAIDEKLAELEDEWDVIHGAAAGADILAARIALRLGHNVRAFPADWATHGKRAGIIRNNQMLDENPSLVIAFWDGESRGTKHTIDEATRRGIPVTVVRAACGASSASGSVGGGRGV